MKKRIILLSAFLICIGSICLSSCSRRNLVQANEVGYLKYCGIQNGVFGDKSIAVYEDTVHLKVIYVATDGFQHPITIGVSDLKFK